MNSYTILIYILKSIFISAVFTGYYYIALRNKSFNYYNRFYLLLSIIGSLIIPLFNFTWFTIEKKEIPVTAEKISSFSIQITDNHSTAFPWLSVVNYVVIGVSLALVLLFARNIFRVYQLKRRSAVLKMEGIDLIYTDLEHAPFSFLNNLFWKESISMDTTYGKKIFKHELTHIHQNHTLDILFCQVVNAIFWMNPFNWLIQKELKAIHEFIADKEAVGNSNVEDFARLLLQAHYGNHFLNPTHSFYYSSIKRRLLMLSTTHQTKFSYLRRVLVLPVSLMAIAVLSVSTTKSKANPVEAPPDATVVIPAVTPQQPAQQIVKNDTTPVPAKAKSQPAKTTKPDASKNDTVISGNGEKMMLKLTPSGEKSANFKEANLRNHQPELTIRAADQITITPSPDSTAKNKTPYTAIYFYEGHPIGYEEVSKINPDRIKSINVWKGEAAVKKFGAIGANGVVELFSKKNPE